MTAPKSIEGGVVNVNFQNNSKVPHEAQIIRIDGAHGAGGAEDREPRRRSCFPTGSRAEGGVGTTPPGESGTATVKLPAGDYAIIDTDPPTTGRRPPAGRQATFKVTGDNGGEIEDTSAKVETKDKGKDVTSSLPRA